MAMKPPAVKPKPATSIKPQPTQANTGKTYKYRWSDGLMHSIPETKHLANVMAAQRVPTATPTAAAAPMGPVTPIAAPPVITDPFLTPTDMASQALELADVNSYLGQVDDKLKNAEIDYQQAQQQNDTAEARNLEASDWNAAARGLAASSIKDQQKAQVGADAAAVRSTNEARIGQARNYAAGEHQRADTVVNPAINTKYNDLAVRNAQAATDAAGAAPDVGAAPDAAAAAPGPSGPPSSPGNATPIAQQYLATHPGGSVQQVGNKIYGLSSKGTWYIIGYV